MAQFGGRAVRDDAAFLKHDDPIEIGDRRRPVSDCRYGAIAHQRLECRLDLDLDLGVERGDRLVEHADRRVLEQRAGSPQTLPLPAGELGAPLADDRRIALR